MNLRLMEALLEALKMAREALNGELGEREIRLTKATLNLRICMLEQDVDAARKAANRMAYDSFRDHYSAAIVKAATA
ncbi:hypothetical protein [Caballeronia sp. Sq4a]|uniref:hypothetical protein n=1 Tax=Caballeronia sp. Sq4a TaxID=2878152 RepID=UPI0020C00D94|nr:hypothetical protein [Caballeronia sp. Sq4a]